MNFPCYIKNINLPVLNSPVAKIKANHSNGIPIDENNELKLKMEQQDFKSSWMLTLFEVSMLYFSVIWRDFVWNSRMFNLRNEVRYKTLFTVKLLEKCTQFLFNFIYLNFFSFVLVN